MPTNLSDKELKHHVRRFRHMAEEQRTIADRVIGPYELQHHREQVEKARQQLMSIADDYENYANQLQTMLARRSRL